MWLHSTISNLKNSKAFTAYWLRNPKGELRLCSTSSPFVSSFYNYNFISDFSGSYYLVLQFTMVIFFTPHFLMLGIMNPL